ncbi:MULTISPECIES: hypothetical protein [unclassified Bradyrhizobium]|uniref:hypothetical protein n=1 Tax=unclassified Bradyrhizobium TaxID=2631580 RepID=UPI0029169B4E|nr:MULTISPECIES: hypothetical protein [unclassified Bradyrhizobium]
MNSPRHRWGDKVRFVNKTEQQCLRCDVVKVGRQEWQGDRSIYWTEYWRELERIDRAGKTPPCSLEEASACGR